MCITYTYWMLPGVGGDLGASGENSQRRNHSGTMSHSALRVSNFVVLMTQVLSCSWELLNRFIRGIWRKTATNNRWTLTGEVMPTSPGVVVILSKCEAVFDFTSPKLFSENMCKVRKYCLWNKEGDMFQKNATRSYAQLSCLLAVSRE